MTSSTPTIEVSSKLAYLQPGMYLVRLMDGASGNVLMLSATPVGRGTIDFFSGDGVLRNTLTKVGDCIVVRVNGALGSLLLTEFHKPGQQHRITVKIDHISKENLKSTFANSDGSIKANNPVKANYPVKANNPDVVAGPSVRMLGHIERVGDTVVQDDWLGDPSSDRRIEGFAIGVLGLPEAVELNYGVLTEGARKYVHASAGQFVGTRQKAKSVMGAVFELTGSAARKFVLTGQAIFLGQPPLAIKSGLELSGPSGNEPLVALHLSIASKDAIDRPLVSKVESAWDNPAITKMNRKSSATKSVSEAKHKSQFVESARTSTAKVVVSQAVNKQALSKQDVVKKTTVKKVTR